MSNVYVAYCIDRHIDGTIELFESKEDAISFCKIFALKRNYELEEEDIKGTVYSANYGTEDEYVCVLERTLNATKNPKI